MGSSCLGVPGTPCPLPQKVEGIGQSQTCWCLLCLDWATFQENKGTIIKFKVSKQNNIGQYFTKYVAKLALYGVGYKCWGCSDDQFKFKLHRWHSLEHHTFSIAKSKHHIGTR